MKNIYKILIIIVACMSVSSYKTIKAEIPPKIFEAIKTSNADLINTYLCPSIEMVILDKDDIFSKQQASVILKDFFSKNKIKSFSIMHQGGKDEAQYAICKISNTNNNNFRVYFLVKQEGGKSLIHQLRIEEE